MSSRLEAHLRDTAILALEVDPARAALLIYDRQSPLAARLAEGWRAVLPAARALDFDQCAEAEIRDAIDALSPGDLVVMVQSQSFRLSQFRFRLELFRRGLVVLEHSHVARIPSDEHETYCNALAYDPAWYRVAGPWMKAKLDRAREVRLLGEGTDLRFTGPFEPATQNIGDYRGMANRGGLFPIGEVFTEASDLRAVNGTVSLFGFANADFSLVVPEEPVRMVVQDGLVIDAPGAPEGFRAVLDQIRADEAVMVRELGFGLNRALTRQKTLTSIGAYERMCGVHLSLGHKHTVYSKGGRGPAKARHHIDVFVALDRALVDGAVVYEAGAYCLDA